MNKILNKIQLIILTETNISDDENELYSIQGYNAIFLNREGRGGGIAVYVNENISFEKIIINTTSFETIPIDITTRNNNVITVFPIYRPPSHNIKTFTEELDQCINNANKKREIILVGDTNIDILKNNGVTTKYLDMLSSNGLQCMVTATTREDVKNNTNTCIDHMFIRSNKTNAHSAVITSTISDHFALFGCLEEGSKKIKNTNASQGSDFIMKINNTKVNNIIRATNWNDIIANSNNANDLFNKIYEIFINAYEKSKETIKQIKKRRPYAWLCDELLKLCEIRKNLYKEWQKNKTNLINEKTYKTFNNKLNKKIIFAKN